MILTDHKSLKFVLFAKMDRYSRIETRRLNYTSQFPDDIRHIPANALSYLPVGVLLFPVSIDLAAMTTDQPTLVFWDVSSLQSSYWMFEHLPVFF